MGRVRAAAHGRLSLPASGPKAVLKDWGFFALGSLAGIAEGLLGLSLIADQLSGLEYAEWAVLSAAMVVVGAASQWGLKTGYMQMVVDLPGLARQRQSLRAGMWFLGATGFAAGSVVALALLALSYLGQWQSLQVLWLLPLSMAFGNLQMLLVTDLRIRRRLHWLTWMSTARVPASALVLLGLSSLGLGGLFLVMLVGALMSAVMLGLLWWAVKPGRLELMGRSLRWRFLGPALRLGTPIMAGLVTKYAADAVVHMGIRWLGSPQLAGDWGRVARMLEPFNSLFFIALMLAWAPNAILMAGDRSREEAARLERVALLFLLVCVAGMPLAVMSAWIMQHMIKGLQTSEALGLWALLGATARMAAFSALSMANYGMVVIRQYGLSLKLYLIELALTLSLFLSALVMGYEVLALVLVGAVPWLVVVACLWRSRRFVVHATLLE